MSPLPLCCISRSITVVILEGRGWVVFFFNFNLNHQRHNEIAPFPECATDVRVQSHFC
jgi:hypothetical protein